jgi:hypothetical protein
MYLWFLREAVTALQWRFENSKELFGLSLWMAFSRESGMLDQKVLSKNNCPVSHMTFECPLGHSETEYHTLLSRGDYLNALLLNKAQFICENVFFNVSTLMIFNSSWYNILPSIKIISLCFLSYANKSCGLSFILVLFHCGEHHASAP